MPKSGGIREYIYNLLVNIVSISLKEGIEYIIYVSTDNYQYALETLSKEYRIKKTPFSSKYPVLRSLFENRFYLEEEAIENFDIFHSPFFHSPKFKKAKIIITVHDLRLYRFPKTYSFLRYVFLKYKVKESVKRADAIIAISNFTRNELIELCHAEKGKITVIHEAIDRNVFAVRNLENYEPNLTSEIKSSDFILSVGHLEPRKNYINLIKAFNIINNGYIKLVIIGKRNHGYKKILKMINRNKKIYYLEFVDSRLLLWLYKNAKLFVFPSFYEGFGFPPLEAASLGTVSAVSNVSSMPEVCGDSVYYFNPFDVDDIANTINFILNNEDKIKEKREKSETHLNNFSWKKNAEETLKLYTNIR
jgi:glycosyltransferase involved in cell wall biosynthesis